MNGYAELITLNTFPTNITINISSISNIIKFVTNLVLLSTEAKLELSFKLL